MDVLNQVVAAEETYFLNGGNRECLLDLVRQLRSKYQSVRMSGCDKRHIMAMLLVLRRIKQTIILEDRLVEMVDSEASCIKSTVKRLLSETISAGCKYNDDGKTANHENEQKYTVPKTRINFPMDISQFLRAWLRDNMDNPYPSDAEKMYFCQNTGLGLAQINNWFINARRRILPFMKGECINFK